MLKKAGDDLTEGMVIGNAAVKQVDKVTGGLASSISKSWQRLLLIKW